jgi:hypothetical protein
MRVRCAGAGAALAELLAKAAQLLLGALEAGGRLAELLLQLGRLTLQPDVSNVTLSNARKMGSLVAS